MEGELADELRNPEPDTSSDRHCTPPETPLDAARQHVRNGQPEQAEAIWRKLISEGGELGDEAAADYADHALRQQHGDIEMEVIERRIAEGDTSPLTWYWAGLVLERRGELVDALVRYSQAVDHLTTEEIGRSPWTRLMASSRRRVKWVLGLELDGIDAIGEVGEVEEADRYFDLLDLLRTPAVVNGQVRVWSRAELAEAREFRPGRITADSIEAYYRQVEDVLREHGEPVAVEFWTFELFMNRVNALLANHAHDLPEEEPIEDEAVGAVWPPGRNEPCWCGSARKYKKCCGSGHPSGRPQAWGPAGLRAGAEVAVGRV